MWIVRLALDRPYTFIVLAIAILIIGPLTIINTPTDIFPNIKIPVISVVWSYTGLPPDEMADRIVGNFERGMSTTVTDIEHIESQSLTGVSVIKAFFYPTVNVELALSQITAVAQTFLRSLPPGTTPPLIITYNASTVPIIQLALSSDTLPEQALNDIGLNTIRSQLANVQGAAAPYPYGGKQRQIQVDLDPRAMQTFGVTPAQINAAVAAQNLIIPAGTEKIGTYEYDLKLNGSPTTIDGLNNMPVKVAGNSVLYLHDVAHVRDGFAPQTNLVRINGKRAVLMTIQKIGETSTLTIIERVKALLPDIRNQLPPSIKVDPIADQSIFVKAAIAGVIREGLIAAVLTAMMILLFLGSWRSTLAIILSIPLAIFTSLICLSSLGETINIMTLGGLALAVGILVDDATVTIENINSHLEEGKEVEESILEGARQIAIPALVSTLSICIVFVPMFFLKGVPKYLFVPLAEAVVFAMLASYFLSRTLVPTLAKYLLRKHEQHDENERHGFQKGFEHGFQTGREWYRGKLQVCLDHGGLLMTVFLIFCALSIVGLGPFLGEDFFPATDAGQIKLHFRAQPGTRIEETARINDQVDQIIRNIIPADELTSITDNLGIPYSGLNLSYSNSGTVGPSDSDVLIQLADKHHPVDSYTIKLRKALNDQLPGIVFAFLPADIVGQILNFGLPAPIDVQIIGKEKVKNWDLAQSVLEKFKQVPGLVDARIQQGNDYPELHIDVDRARADTLGISQSDIAQNLLITLSGSFQTAPAFWLDRKTGISYNMVTQAPQYRLTSLNDLRNIPVSIGSSTGTTGGSSQQILGSFATVSRGEGPTTVSHYNSQPVYDVYANVQGRDLGSVSNEVDKIVADAEKAAPKSTKIIPRGQMLTRRQSFSSLYYGLLFSIVLVYLLIVVNFQSWIDPLIIISALPAALAGIVWMLFTTHTTLSVPALTGAIMCIGVATANSILVVSFAREHMAEGNSPFEAALESGFSRLRPVLMTALAMIIGMVPMALALGEGGEQNAPLGRAVIGGLVFSTVATLFFVPVVFAAVHTRLQKRTDRKRREKLGDEEGPSYAH